MIIEHLRKLARKEAQSRPTTTLPPTKRQKLVVKRPINIVSNVRALGQDGAELQIVPFESFAQSSRELMLEKLLRT